MPERIEARMQQKHASAQKWDEIPNFVPEAGEIIIYDKDPNDESVTKPRVKVGDGITRVQDLKFIVGELYVQNEQPPEDAGEGAVWFDTSSSGSSGGNTGMAVFSNWDSQEGESGYI